MNNKRLVIDDETWEKLAQIKLDKRAKSMAVVVKVLLKRYLNGEKDGKQRVHS